MTMRDAMDGSCPFFVALLLSAVGVVAGSERAMMAFLCDVIGINYIVCLPPFLSQAALIQLTW